MKKLGISLAVAMALSAPVLADSMASENKTQNGMDIEAARTASFGNFDTNSDNYIDSDEAARHAGLHMRMKQYDANGDSRLDMAEYNSLRDAHSQEYFSHVDTNRDGYVSRDEAKAHEELHTGWRNLDVDADDRLDKGEFARFEPTGPGWAKDHPMDSATGGDQRPGVTTEGKKN